MNIHDPHPKTGAKNYMAQARSLIAIYNLCSPRDYNTVEAKVDFSDDRAGPPALRLAYAIRDFENRLSFPKRPALATQEENGYAHLCTEHSSVPKARRYRVWYAIEAFREIREAVFGGPLLVDVEVPPLSERDVRSERALASIHFWLEKTRKPYLEQMLRICVCEVDPVILVLPLSLLGDAVWSLEKWRQAGCPEGPLRERFVKADKALASFRHRNGWVGNTPLATAIGIMNATFPSAKAPA